MSFESFCEALERAYLSVIRESLPPSESSRGLWRSTDRLEWIGLIEEQDRFYVSFSFGQLLETNELVQTNLSTRRFDYLESHRLNGDMFPDSDTEALRDVFSEVLSEGLPEENEELDEDDYEDARHDLRRLAALTGLGMLALKLMANRELLPMPVSPEFRVTISDDIETPTWPAHLTSVSVRDEEIRARLLDQLCATQFSKALFADLLRAGDENSEDPDLLEILAHRS